MSDIGMLILPKNVSLDRCGPTHPAVVHQPSGAMAPGFSPRARSGAAMQFQCAHCGRGFTTKGGYLEHQRYHSGQFRYFCAICSKGFMNVVHYRSHVDSHANRKPFECQHCRKAFSVKSNMTRHEKLCRAAMCEVQHSGVVGT